MITIKQLKEISMKHLDAQSIELIYILAELDNTIELSDSLLVYPKHLYQLKDSIELYLFTPNRYLIMATHRDNVTSVKTRSLNKLECIESIITDECRQLRLQFDEGECLSFSPNDDTPLIYRREFNHQLKQIIRYLHDSPLL